MAKYSRGEFLGFGAALAGACGLGRLPAAAAQAAPAAVGTEPDLVVLNGVVYTSDAANPRAEAFAVKNGRFVAVTCIHDRSEEHTSELQSQSNLVCRLLLEK